MGMKHRRANSVAHVSGRKIGKSAARIVAKQATKQGILYGVALAGVGIPTLGVAVPMIAALPAIGLAADVLVEAGRGLMPSDAGNPPRPRRSGTPFDQDDPLADQSTSSQDSVGRSSITHEAVTSEEVLRSEDNATSEKSCCEPHDLSGPETNERPGADGGLENGEGDIAKYTLAGVSATGVSVAGVNAAGVKFDSIVKVEINVNEKKSKS